MKKTKSKSKSKRAAKADPARRRGAAAPALPELKVARGAKGMRQAIAIMCDTAQPLAVRAEALRALQAASFGAPEFEGVRADYVAGLRRVAEDPEPELRRRALAVLSQERDPYAERVLVAGLKDPAKALVPAGDALHYLSYNVHAGVQSLARSIFETAGEDNVRQQALRLMSNDPDSAAIIERALADKNEPVAVRQMSAAALHSLNPQALQAWAGRAAADDAEDSNIVATSLTALNQFGDSESIAGNTALRRRLTEMRTEGSAEVKQLAQALVTKHRIE